MSWGLTRSGLGSNCHFWVIFDSMGASGSAFIWNAEQILSYNLLIFLTVVASIVRLPLAFWSGSSHRQIQCFFSQEEKYEFLN